METVKKFLTNWWTVTGLILVLCLGLFCFGLPIFVGFMRPLWVKLIFALLILSLWGGFAFWRWRKAKTSSEALAIELAHADMKDEGSELAGRMTEALGQFKSESGNRRDYLYSRPWYVIIGPPGAGKTTALLNSGLRFPFSEQAVKGVGGTRNLDFWFAEEAVLIDTAGRYTSQDSDRAKDAKAWKDFLGLLKKHRPLQPINGVMVAIGLDEILSSDQTALDNHSATVRRRLSEIRHCLEVLVPVYIVFTKADLLAGFSEFFDDLDVEARREVLGATLDFNTQKLSLEALVTSFDEMAQAIADRQTKRLNDEPDSRRRSLILGFPAQVSALRARFIRFLEGVFGGNDEPEGVLRGFYLASGVQSGAPFDRLLSNLGDVYDQPQVGQSGAGRAYFLNKLMTMVMFGEAGLVQMEPSARLRIRTQLSMALLGIAGFCGLLTVLWGISLFGNRVFQDNLDKNAQAAANQIKDQGIDLVEVGPNDADLEQAVSALDSLRALPQGYAERHKKGAPFFMTFGLYQDGHSKRAITMYQEGLRRILLARLLLRLESYMRQNQNNPLAVYEPLKVYLMLGGQKPDGIDVKSIKAWVINDWEFETYPGADQADLRRRLAGHLDALLDDKNLSDSWNDQQAPLDMGLIGSVRAAVQTLSMSDRAYSIMLQKAASLGRAPWTSGSKLSSGDALAFANGEEVMNLKVPYFFTREGYEQVFLPGLATIQSDIEKDIWVLGKDANTNSVKQEIRDIRPGVANHYARDYIEAWEGVISSLKPADYFNNLPAFGSFTKTRSPLKLILVELKKNTSFTKLKTPSQLEAASKAIDIKSRLNEIDAAHEISNHFSPIHAYIGDEKSQAPIDDFIKSIRDSGQAIAASKSMGGGAGADTIQGQSATANAALSLAASQAPAGPLQSFAQAAAKGGSQAQSTVAQGAVTGTYSTSVLPACMSATQDRYPFFSASANDMTALDAQRVFGSAGTLDTYITQKLMPMLDMSGPVWRWRTENPIAAGLNPNSADSLSKSVEIRDLVIGGFSFKIEANGFGPEVDAIDFASGGTSYRFDLATKGQPRPMNWTLQGTPEAYLTLYKSGQKLDTISKEGVWALFRLVETARKQNSGTNAFTATFGQGYRTATLKFTLNGTNNPFSRAGIWTFRCPAAL